MNAPLPFAEKRKFRIRASLQRCRRFFELRCPFSVCVRTGVLAIRWNEGLDNTAPEGRPNLAQRFSAGKSGKNDLSPGGTTHFSRTLLGAVLRKPSFSAICLSAGAASRGSAKWRSQPVRRSKNQERKLKAPQKQHCNPTNYSPDSPPKNQGTQLGTGHCPLPTIHCCSSP